MVDDSVAGTGLPSISFHDRYVVQHDLDSFKHLHKNKEYSFHFRVLFFLLQVLMGGFVFVDSTGSALHAFGAKSSPVGCCWCRLNFECF